MAEPELAVVYSPREWANRVVRHITDHGGGRVRLRVVDRRVCLEEEFDVLIAEDVTSFLDDRFVKELRGRGRRILGVYDPAEPTGKERLLELGVDDVIESTAPAEDFVRSIGRIRPARAPEPAPGVDGDLAGAAAQGDERREGPAPGWGPGRRVKGSLAHAPYRSNLAKMGGRLILGVHKATLAAAGKDPGDLVTISIEVDSEPR